MCTQWLTLHAGTVTPYRQCIKSYVKDRWEDFLCLAHLYKSSRKDKQTPANNLKVCVWYAATADRLLKFSFIFRAPFKPGAQQNKQALTVLENWARVSAASLSKQKKSLSSRISMTVMIYRKTRWRSRENITLPVVCFQVAQREVYKQHLAVPGAPSSRASCFSPSRSDRTEGCSESNSSNVH